MKYNISFIAALTIIIACGGCSKRQESNTGKKWTKINAPSYAGGSMPDQIAASFFYTQNTLFMGGVDGIYHTHDGLSWAKDIGVPGMSITHEIVSNSAGTVFAANDGGIYYLASGGTNEVGLGPAEWRRLDAGGTGASAMSIVVGGTNIIHSEIIRELVWPIANPFDRDTFFLGTSKFVGDNQNVFSVGEDEVWRSFNNGKSWTLVTRNGLPSSYSVTAAFLNAGKLFLATLDGEVYYLTISGGSWLKTKISEPLIGGVAKFAATPTDMYLAAPQGVFISKDFGLSWAKDNSDVVASATYNLAIGDKLIYAVMGDGLYTKPVL